MGKVNCPYCDEEANINKEKTPAQLIEQEVVERMLKEKNLLMPIHQDVWCDKCNAHMTVVRGEIATASRR